MKRLIERIHFDKAGPWKQESFIVKLVATNYIQNGCLDFIIIEIITPTIAVFSYFININCKRERERVIEKESCEITLEWDILPIK